MRLLESAVPNARDCRLVERVLGWDGHGGCCLKVAGEELGITRERARQIYNQVIERIQGCNAQGPLDEVLAFVTLMSNRAAGEIEAELQRRGFTKYLFSIQALLKTAQVFGRPADFSLEETGGKMFVVGGAGVVRSIMKGALRASARYGVQNVSALCSAIPRMHQRPNDRLLVREVLNTRRDICWLDSAAEIFWLSSVPRNPMVRCVKKVISYAGPVSLSDLHRAIGRLPAKHRTPLSRRLLTKFCEQAPFCRVINGCVERATPFRASGFISDAESIVCRILRRNGNELSVQRLRHLCAAAGVPKPNFWRIVLYSPLIFRRAPGVYRLLTPSSNRTEVGTRRTA